MTRTTPAQREKAIAEGETASEQGHDYAKDNPYPAENELRYFWRAGFADAAGTTRHELDRETFTEEELAFEEGIFAARRNVIRCPYSHPMHRHLSEAWANGWNAAAPFQKRKMIRRQVRRIA